MLAVYSLRLILSEEVLWSWGTNDMVKEKRVDSERETSQRDSDSILRRGERNGSEWRQAWTKSWTRALSASSAAVQVDEEGVGGDWVPGGARRGCMCERVDPVDHASHS